MELVLRTYRTTNLVRISLYQLLAQSPFQLSIQLCTYFTTNHCFSTQTINGIRVHKVLYIPYRVKRLHYNYA